MQCVKKWSIFNVTMDAISGFAPNSKQAIAGTNSDQNAQRHMAALG